MNLKATNSQRESADHLICLGDWELSTAWGPGVREEEPMLILSPTLLPRIPFSSEQPGPSASWPPGGTGPAVEGPGLSGQTRGAAAAQPLCVPSAWRSSLRAR